MLPGHHIRMNGHWSSGDGSVLAYRGRTGLSRRHKIGANSEGESPGSRLQSVRLRKRTREEAHRSRTRKGRHSQMRTTTIMPPFCISKLSHSVLWRSPRRGRPNGAAPTPLTCEAADLGFQLPFESKKLPSKKTKVKVPELPLGRV